MESEEVQGSLGSNPNGIDSIGTWAKNSTAVVIGGIASVSSVSGSESGGPYSSSGSVTFGGIEMLEIGAIAPAGTE